MSVRLAIHILTGRQHQIRLQMSHVGHPTVSDKSNLAKEALHPHRMCWGGENKQQLQRARCLVGGSDDVHHIFRIPLRILLLLELLAGPGWEIFARDVHPL